MTRYHTPTRHSMKTRSAKNPDLCTPVHRRKPICPFAPKCKGMRLNLNAPNMQNTFNANMGVILTPHPSTPVCIRGPPVCPPAPKRQNTFPNAFHYAIEAAIHATTQVAFIEKMNAAV